MRLKQAIRYQLRAMTRPTIIFYLVLLLVYITSFIIKLVLRSGTMEISGAEISSFIFLFVMGMNSFKSQFFLFLQNGISRKTLLLGFVLTALILSTGMCVVDSIYPRLFSNLTYQSLIADLYNLSGFWGHLNSAAWAILFGFFALCAGFFITTLYYNMNAVLKAIVSAGVPIALFIIIPIVQELVPSFKFYTVVFKFIGWCLGSNLFSSPVSTTMDSVRPLLVFITGSAIMSGLSYLLIRRATIKE